MQGLILKAMVVMLALHLALHLCLLWVSDCSHIIPVPLSTLPLVCSIFHASDVMGISHQRYWHHDSSPCIIVSVPFLEVLLLFFAESPASCLVCGVTVAPGAGDARQDIE